MGQPAKHASLGVSDRPVISMNPATGEEFAHFKITPADEVERVVAAAQSAWPDWHGRGVSRRCAVLRKWYTLLYAHSREMAELLAQETGKPLPEALIAEVMTSLDIMAYYLERGPQLLKPHKWRHDNIALKFKQAAMEPIPWGVVGVITPWNYPLMLPVGTVFPALMAGNSVVLKPAEYTTSIAMRMHELALQAGVPHHVFQLIPGDGNTGAALIKSGINRAVFIGSERAGRQVARACAEQLIPVTLELGGSDPMLVLADAPLRTAAAAAIWGRFTNAGQTCIAVKRVFVEEPVYDAFIAKVLSGVKKLRMGNGMDPDIDMGPMIRESQVQTLERQLADAVAKGARVRAGGRRRTDLGPLFFEPTVLTEVTPEMAVMQEETFGPLLPVMPVKDAAEAVKLANQTPYGLSASIWTRDTKRGYALAQQIQAGSVTVNDTTFHPGACDVAYGGFKNSGLGKTHGDAGLLEMVKEQYIDVDPLGWQYKPWWFGYARSLQRKASKFIQFAHGRSWRERLAAAPGSLTMLWHRRKL